MLNQSDKGYNYFQKCMCKKLKNIKKFLFRINEHQCLNTPKLLITEKIWQSLSMGEFFS